MTDAVHIITYDEVNELARPCSADDDVIMRFIDEAERNDLRLNMGDETFSEVMKSVAEGDSSVEVLLNGGQFVDRCGNSRIFEGLKRTLAYYAYARIVQNGSSYQTRFGYVEKEDDYSRNAETKYRIQAYGGALENANRFMCASPGYISAEPDPFPATCRKCHKRMIKKGGKISQIGN